MSSATPAASETLGAYGIAVPPALFAPRLNALPAATPRWSFDLEPPTNDVPPDAGGLDHRTTVTLDGSHASATLLAGTLRADGDRRAATLTPYAPIDGERLVHPTLAALGAFAAHWANRAALHAGAVLVDGAAWAVLAGRFHGKSTTLAALDQAGLPVLTDDLLVIDDTLAAHAGPRCLDLRDTSAALFPEAAQVDDHPDRRERFRLALQPVPPTAPLAGFLTLGWDDATGLTPVKPADRLNLIASSATLRGIVINPRLLLDLATRPSYVLHRPQQLDSLGATIELVRSLGSRSA